MTTSLKPNLSPQYGYADTVFATINNDVETWAFANDTWREWPIYEVRFKTKYLSRAEFEYMFLELYGVAFPPVG